MKKILWLALALLMSFAFIGCSEEGASMNEDYAGTWYLDLLGIKYDMTDTSYETAVYADIFGYVNLTKGTITKLTATTIEMQQTHEWNGFSWDEVSVEADEVVFSLSADGHTLTMDGVDLSDTDPSN